MRTKPDRRRRQGGFSLLEALGAATLLSVAMLALTMTSITLARGTKTADSLSAATALAQETLEQIRALPLGAPGHAPGDYADPDNPVQADGSPGGRFTRTWSISDEDDPDFGLKTLTVTVAWNDPQPHTMQLAGFVRCSEVPCP
jgi:type II secretory pathway pseudopilin PulG